MHQDFVLHYGCSRADGTPDGTRMPRPTDARNSSGVTIRLLTLQTDPFPPIRPTAPSLTRQASRWSPERLWYHIPFIKRGSPTVKMYWSELNLRVNWMSLSLILRFFFKILKLFKKFQKILRTNFKPQYLTNLSPPMLTQGWVHYGNKYNGINELPFKIERTNLRKQHQLRFFPQPNHSCTYLSMYLFVFKT